MATENNQSNTNDPGQSQRECFPAELDVHYADVDERSTKDLLMWTKAFASQVVFHEEPTTPPQAKKDWSKFFPYDDSDVQSFISRPTKDIAPHLGMFTAFLELYKHPQEIINRFTGRHLDFYYQDVLGLKEKPSVPDKAHVLLELKKNASPVKIDPVDGFSAGKDDQKAEMLFVPTRTSIVRHSEIASVRSYFRDDRGHGTIRAAPIANSSDGLGEPLDETEPKWNGFGSIELPESEVGFAIASPVLRMQEGTRVIHLTLQVANLPGSLTESDLVGAFDAYVTGPKGWMQVLDASPTLQSGRLKFALTVPVEDPAVIDYDSEIHGYNYSTATPVLHVLFKPNSQVGYDSLVNVIVNKVKVVVVVSGITSLHLENDNGTLDPKKAFQPFGAEGTRGSRLFVGYDEALSKKLSKLEFTVQWKDAPNNFNTHYRNYGKTVINSSFQAAVAFKDAGTWNEHQSVQLFESGDATSPHVITFQKLEGFGSKTPSNQQQVSALDAAGGKWSNVAARQSWVMNPVWKPPSIELKERLGFVTFALETDFLHSVYRSVYVKKVVEYAKYTGTNPLVIPNEPYSPVIQSLTFTYRAYTDTVNLSASTLDSFANDDVTFFHIEGFGTKREHSYQRNQFDFLNSKSVSLLPTYPHRGELLIGLNDLHAGDSVSLLFQVAEGSADPEQMSEEIEWFALCDNYWRPLLPNEVVLDTTNDMLASGIVTIVVPQQATTENTVLPTDLLWIKAAVSDRVGAVSKLIEVATNAVEVEFKDRGNDPQRMEIPQKTITKLKVAKAEVKKVKQPYASFGGKRGEAKVAFHERVAERLRHRDRCLTAWDYERMALEAFPNVHRAKCIPHADGDSWLSPGHVLLILIPDLRNQNAVNPLEPKVSADLIRNVVEYVRARTVRAPLEKSRSVPANLYRPVEVHAKNPRYQKVEFDFKVKMKTGFEFNFYRQQLNQELVQLLSPWAFDQNKEIAFGETVYKSVVLDHVEELEYVDYVTDFQMFSYTGSTSDSSDLNTARPQSPDAILVSTPQHRILPAG